MLLLPKKQQLLEYLIVFVYCLLNFTIFISLQIYANCIYTKNKGSVYYTFDLYRNSDAVSINTIIDDIVHKKGNLKNWYFGASPYFFPDYLVAFFSALFTKNIFWQGLISGAVQFFLFSCCIHCLFKQMSCRYSTKKIIVLYSLLALCSLSSQQEVYGFSWILAFHFGAFLCQIVSIYFGMKVWCNLQQGSCRAVLTCFKENKYSIAVLCAFTFLMALSDKLFLLQWTAPYIVLVVLWNRQMWRMPMFYFLYTLLLLGSAGLGLSIPVDRSLTATLHKTPIFFFTTELSESSWANNIAQFKNLFINIFHTSPWIIAVYALFGYCVIFSVYKTHSLSAPTFRDHKKIFIERFFCLSFFLNILTIAANTRLILRDQYLIPVFYWPFIWLVFLIPNGYFELGKRKYINFHSGMAVLYLAIFLKLLTFYPHLNAQASIYPPSVACIDRIAERFALKNGVAAYWSAKSIQSLSRANLVFAQIKPDGSPYLWITSKAYYKKEYDFLVFNTQDHSEKAWISYLRLTAKGRIYQADYCEPYMVLVFDHQDKLYFDVPE